MLRGHDGRSTYGYSATRLVLSLKGNHSTLHDDIRLFLLTEIEKSHQAKPHRIIDQYEDHSKGHGRIEHRLCYVTDQIDWLTQRDDWCDLKTIAVVESRVTVGDKTSHFAPLG